MPTSRMKFRVSTQTHEYDRAGSYRTAYIDCPAHTLAVRFRDDGLGLNLNVDLLKAKSELNKEMIKAILDAEWEINE